MASCTQAIPRQLVDGPQHSLDVAADSSRPVRVARWIPQPPYGCAAGGRPTRPNFGTTRSGFLGWRGITASGFQAAGLRSGWPGQQYGADDIADDAIGQDIDVVYNGAGAAYHSALGLDMEQEARRIRARLTAGQPYFVFVGTQHPRKNMEGLLRAFRHYREQGGQWDLLLVGKAMWRKRGFDVRDAMEEMPREIKAHIHGSDWLPQNQLASVLAAAGGLVFIPWFEGFGIPLIEAFSAGTPTIHSDRTSLPEVAAGAGLEVDPGDATAVAEAMLRLEREPALGERLVELGRRRAEEFSWERTASLLWNCMARAGEEAGLDMGPAIAEET